MGFSVPIQFVNAIAAVVSDSQKGSLIVDFHGRFSIISLGGYDRILLGCDWLKQSAS